MFKSEKGASAVEFALIAPLLFVLTFGIIEFSIMLFDKAVVTNASREGARAAVVYNYDGANYDPLDVAGITAVVANYTNQYLINIGGTSTPATTVTYQDPDGNTETNATVESGDDVTVTVSYTYNFLVFPDLSKLLGGSFNGTKNLVGTTVMRME